MKKKKREAQEVNSNLVTNNKTEELRAKGHHYVIDTIKLAREFIIECCISFRGTEKAFKFHKSFESATPNFSTIRKWLLRIGLYELKRKKEECSDWIFIIDLTVELGKQKVLVVLGISQKRLVEQVLPELIGLCHQDMELLALEIMDSTKGEIIKDKLEQRASNSWCSKTNSS